MQIHRACKIQIHSPAKYKFNCLQIQAHFELDKTGHPLTPLWYQTKILILGICRNLRDALPLARPWSYPSPLSPGRGGTIIICVMAAPAASCISQILSYVFLSFWNIYFFCPYLLSPGQMGTIIIRVFLKSSSAPLCNHIPIQVLHPHIFIWQGLFSNQAQKAKT